jgi:hypothetical protein
LAEVEVAAIAVLMELLVDLAVDVALEIVQPIH